MATASVLAFGALMYPILGLLDNPTQLAETQLAEEFLYQCSNNPKKLKKWLSERKQREIADSIRALPISPYQDGLGLTSSMMLAVHVAARIAGKEIMQAFVEKGFGRNAKTKHDQTPIYLAAQNKEHPEVLNYLLSLEGIKVDVPKEGGQTALWHAARSSNTDAVKALIDRGASPKAVKMENGWTVLHCAIWYGDLDMVKALVAAGADLNAKTKDGKTPIYLAAQNKEHPEVLNYLLSLEGIKVDVPKEGGQTALWHAARSSNTDAVKALIDRGASPKAVKMENGWTVLHCAIRYGDLDMVKALVAAGADLNAKTKDGKTPLHLSARYQDVVGVKALLKAGADPNAKTEEGVTPLYFAQKNENPEERAKIIALLKEYGATEEGHETTPTAAFPSAPWLDIKVAVRSSDRTFQTDKAGIRLQTAFTLDGETNDLYPVNGRLRSKSLAVMATAPVYGLANSVIQLASIVYDTAVIAYNAIKNFACHLGSGKIKEAFKALVGYGIITAAAFRTYRAIISPFIGVAMSFASMYGLVSPNKGRKVLNTLSDHLNDNQRYLGVLGLEKVGNLDEKVHGLPKYARKA